jgi:hypothetical protein
VQLCRCKLYIPVSLCRVLTPRVTLSPLTSGHFKRSASTGPHQVPRKQRQPLCKNTTKAALALALERHAVVAAMTSSRTATTSQCFWQPTSGMWCVLRGGQGPLLHEPHTLHQSRQRLARTPIRARAVEAASKCDGWGGRDTIKGVATSPRQHARSVATERRRGSKQFHQLHGVLGRWPLGAGCRARPLRR